jgi:hypothetical protein
MVEKKSLITPELIENYDNLQTEIKRLEAEKDKIQAIIKRELEPGNYDAGNYTIDLTETIGTLNKPIFMRDYPEDEFPELYESVPSTEAIKRAFGDDRAEFYTPSLRLSIKPKTAKKIK